MNYGFHCLCFGNSEKKTINIFSVILTNKNVYLGGRQEETCIPNKDSVGNRNKQITTYKASESVPPETRWQ